MFVERLAHAIAEERDDVARDRRAQCRMSGEIAEHGTQIEEAGRDAPRLPPPHRRRCARTRRRADPTLRSADAARRCRSHSESIRATASARWRIGAPLARRSRTVPSSRCGSFCEPSIAICCVRCGSAGLRKRAISCVRYDARSTPGGARERRRDLLPHLPLDEQRERRIGRRLPDELVPREETEIRERRVAAVQEAQLHRLERRDVGDDLRAVVLPCGTRAGEAVLDHPLPERLEHDRRRVGQSGEARGLGNVGRGRRGNDPVDHRRRKT